jgi:hypothetical protein
MIASPLLVVGLVAGLWVRRWTLVVAVALIGLAISLSGWLTGWAGDQETPAAGGAILLAADLWIPLALGAALGVYLRRARQGRGQPQTSSRELQQRQDGNHTR